MTRTEIINKIYSTGKRLNQRFVYFKQQGIYETMMHTNIGQSLLDVNEEMIEKGYKKKNSKEYTIQYSKNKLEQMSNKELEYYLQRLVWIEQSKYTKSSELRRYKEEERKAKEHYINIEDSGNLISMLWNRLSKGNVATNKFESEDVKEMIYGTRTKMEQTELDKLFDVDSANYLLQEYLNKYENSDFDPVRFMDEMIEYLHH